MSNARVNFLGSSGLMHGDYVTEYFLGLRLFDRAIYLKIGIDIAQETL